MKPIAIGADSAATILKSQLKEFLVGKGIEVVDYSSDTRNDLTDYPDVAHQVALAIKQGQHERGILVCGTGIGMAIVANKVPGIRAAQCHDVYSAQRARKSNDAQIISLGARVIGAEYAKVIIEAWLASEFEEGSSTPKVAKIAEYEIQDNVLNSNQ